MNFNRKVLLTATLRLVAWVAVIGITWYHCGFYISMIWPLLALQHRLGRQLRG